MYLNFDSQNPPCVDLTNLHLFLLLSCLSPFHSAGLWRRPNRPHGANRLISSLEIRWALPQVDCLCSSSSAHLLRSSLNHFQVSPLLICWGEFLVSWMWSPQAAPRRPRTCLASSPGTRIKWASRRGLSTLWWVLIATYAWGVAVILLTFLRLKDAVCSFGGELWRERNLLWFFMAKEINKQTDLKRQHSFVLFYFVNMWRTLPPFFLASNSVL